MPVSDHPSEAFAVRLAASAAAVSARLDALLAPVAAGSEIIRPRRLLEAMRYACLSNGKRLRPFLVIETLAACRPTADVALRERGLSAAAAIEMIHAYSLVHDDLPAMDDDDLRRGVPTLHKAFDEATAILAGDALLTYAFRIMATADRGDDGMSLGLVAGLADAAGMGGMAGGQSLDLLAETAAKPLTEAEVAELQAMKTGALLRFAVEAGARLGGASPEDLAALTDFGRALGATFQIADDILDAEGDSLALGKKAGKDAGRNKATLVAALGIEAAKRRRDACVETALAALGRTSLGEQCRILGETARFAAWRKS